MTPAAANVTYNVLITHHTCFNGDKLDYSMLRSNSLLNGIELSKGEMNGKS